MKIYKYKNYAEYIKAQQIAFEKKFKNVWAKEENIKVIAEYLKLDNPKQGLCHGTRQGWEQIWFMKYLPGCKIIGTEIGKIKNKFTLQRDFNKEYDDLKNRFDFIYSNSFDHAYDPEETFNIWCGQIKAGGFIVFEYDRRQEHTGEISKPANKTDPISITIRELIDKVKEWHSGTSVVDILDMPIITQEWRKAIIINVT